MSETKNIQGTEARRISRLEAELKTAFGEGRFEMVRLKADELLKLDPKNRLAIRVSERAKAEEASAIRKANGSKIKELELRMEQALRGGDLPTVNGSIAEIRKMDPQNKKAAKTQELIDRAKADLEREIMRERIRKVSAEIDMFLGRMDWVSVEAKANELLALEWGNKVAMGAIEKAAKAKHVDPKTLITVKEPVVQKRPGFFARLFGAKTAVPSMPESKTLTAVEAKKPELKPVVPVTVVKPVAITVAPKVSEVKAPAVVVAKPTVVVAPKVEVRPAPAAPAKSMPKDEKKLEADMRKEKIGGLTREIAEKMKVLEWDKAVAKANELLEADWGNPAAVRAILKAAEAKKVQAYELVKAAAPKDFKKFGFLAKMLGLRLEVPAKPIPAPVVVKQTTAKPELKPVAPVQAPKMEAKPVSVPVPTLKPIEPVKPIPVAAVKPVELKASVAPGMSPAVVLSAPVKPAAPIATTPVVPVVVPVTKAPVAPVAAVPAVKPIEPIKSEVKSVAAPAPVVPVQLKVEQQAVAKAGAVAKPEEGNIFTRLFGQKAEPEANPKAKPAGSVLETIVAAQAASSKKAETASKTAKGQGMVEFLPKFAGALLQFAVVFIVISAAFFYVQNMDSGNRVLSRFGEGLQSHAYQLRQAADKVDELKDRKDELSKEIARYSGKDVLKNQAMETVNQIVSARMDWSDMLRKLSEVTETVYAKNSLSQYVQYNNYTYNVNTGQFTVSGTLSDPLGKNLTKLAELEQALRTYPKNPEDPTDKTVPYFYGFQEFNSFSKNFNSSTGRYQSSFTFSLSTKPRTK